MVLLKLSVGLKITRSSAIIPARKHAAVGIKKTLCAQTAQSIAAWQKPGDATWWFCRSRTVPPTGRQRWFFLIVRIS
jgi:hypothetical protein